MPARREIRKEANRRFGHHPLAHYQYAPDSRSVLDFVETILLADSRGDADEADYWRGELLALVPKFTETV